MFEKYAPTPPQPLFHIMIGGNPQHNNCSCGILYFTFGCVLKIDYLKAIKVKVNKVTKLPIVVSDRCPAVSVK